MAGFTDNYGDRPTIDSASYAIDLKGTSETMGFGGQTIEPGKTYGVALNKPLTLGQP